MDSDTTMDSNSSKFEHLTCITVYPVLIKRIVSHCDISRLLNEYIFKGENAHHEKYMVRTSGKIENGQFAIYFTNKVSAETIYETMKSQSIFACEIPRKQFLTSPNKDQFIAQTMRSWKWKKVINLHNDFKEYSFTNCYQIEHAIENKHEAVVLTINHDENQDVNNTKTWHLIIFSSEFAQKDRNIQNICKTDQIEIVSEICYQGMVTNIDSSKNGGYVRNKKWHATHQFIIDKQYESKIIPESHYVSLEPIKSDGIAQNIDIVSKTTLCSRREIPDQLSNFNGSLIKLTSTETSPIMFISPTRRNTIATNQSPKHTHPVAQSRFIVNNIDEAHDRQESRSFILHSRSNAIVHDILSRNNNTNSLKPTAKYNHTGKSILIKRISVRKILLKIKDKIDSSLKDVNWIAIPKQANMLISINGLIYKIIFNANIKHLTKIPRVYIVTRPIPTHININSETGQVSPNMTYLEKEWKKKQKYYEKIYVLISSICFVASGGSLNKMDILNKSARWNAYELYGWNQEQEITKIKANSRLFINFDKQRAIWNKKQMENEKLYKALKSGQLYN